MQQANHYLQSTKLGKPQDSTSKQEPLEAKAMDRLWLRMAEIYGHRWVSSYGAKPNDTWSTALGAFEFDQIKTGLNVMLEKNIEWPPTLTEFISYCKDVKRDPIHQEYQLPPPCNIDREEGKKRSAALIEMMKGAN